MEIKCYEYKFYGDCTLKYEDGYLTYDKEPDWKRPVKPDELHFHVLDGIPEIDVEAGDGGGRRCFGSPDIKEFFLKIVAEAGYSTEPYEEPSLPGDRWQDLVRVV